MINSAVTRAVGDEVVASFVTATEGGFVWLAVGSVLVGLSVIEDIGAAVGSELASNSVGSGVDITDVGAVVLAPPVKLGVGTGDGVLSPLTLSDGAKLDTSEEPANVGAFELVIFVTLGVGTGDEVVVLNPDTVPPSVGDKDTLDDSPLDPVIVGDELSLKVVGASVPDASYV